MVSHSIGSALEYASMDDYVDTLNTRLTALSAQEC
uniref:Uncharacterized protein n=1 Tax=Peronospora matthiolae TaxID=2874970 RepID=A0AAV1TH27_9STRA